MSFAASYSLNTSPPVWVNLPGILRTPIAPMHGSAFDADEQNIVHETNRGVRRVYRLFEREVWRLVFRFSETEKPSFRAMHDAVDGQINPFYFRVGTTILFCRKEAGFRPRMLADPTRGPVYDYELILTEEITATTF